MTLVVAGLLATGGCSRQKEEAVQSVQTTPDPNLPNRAERQQDAINKAAEQLKKEEEQRAAGNPSPTPSVAP